MTTRSRKTMNKHHNYGLYLATILVLLVGCGIITFGGTQQSNIQGNDGLVMTVGTLPSELFVGQGLDIQISLENVGTQPVQNAILALAGYDPNVVKLRTSKIEGINLGGRSNFVPVGEKTVKTFTINSINLPDANQRKETFVAYACYQYQTQASPVVCINPLLAYGKTPEQVQTGCNFVDAELTPTQGAPLAVSKVQTWYLSDTSEVELRIFVKDVSGKGVAVDNLAYAKRCTSTEPLKSEEQNKVHLEAFLSGKKLQCAEFGSQQYGVEDFNIQENVPISCKAQINPNEPGFTSPLSVYLTYGYVIGDVFSITLRNPSFTGK